MLLGTYNVYQIKRPLLNKIKNRFTIPSVVTIYIAVYMQSYIVINK